MLLNNEWFSNDFKEEIKTYLEKNENENTTIQNLWATGKAILSGKFMALEAYLKKTRKSSNKNLTPHLKEPEKEQQRLK